jgi:hypothetical protein
MLTDPVAGPSDDPPVQIKRVQYWQHAAKINNRGPSGFGVAFMLLDAVMRPTRWDGTLSIRVYSYSSIFTKFKIKVPVRKEDFRASARAPDWFGYVYEHPEPVITSNQFRNYAEVDFFPKDSRRKLKGTTWTS